MIRFMAARGSQAVTSTGSVPQACELLKRDPWNIGAEGEIMPTLEEDHYLEEENKMLRDRTQRLSPLSGSLLQKQMTGTDTVL